MLKQALERPGVGTPPSANIPRPIIGGTEAGRDARRKRNLAGRSA